MCGQRSVSDTQVLIVGAGPVGLTLAIDLGRRGMRCILIEQKEAPQFLPKMERCNARTMEIYRRIGLAEKIRDAGFPRDVPMDVFIVLVADRAAAAAPALSFGRRGAGRDQRHATTARCRSSPISSSRNIRSSRCSSRSPRAAECRRALRLRVHVLRAGCRAASRATVQDAAARPTRSAAHYLVGCDGGASAVRQQLGIKLHGEANLMQLRQAFYRCDDLFDRIPIGKGGRHYHVADAHSDVPDRAGFDQALHAAFGRRDRRRYEDDVREDRRHASAIRDAVLQSVAAEFAARRQLSARAASSSPATPCIWSSRPAGSA